PNIEDIRKYCYDAVDTIWDEVQRFENPHTYYVDLSQKLWDERDKLLKAHAAEK
ncbi:MAG: nicotinate phosphoribosyltransferase, partial [Acutalibacteraceae bacterium]|nr:nicotinate phosphoribosyltransferase [Acutalibacteraceae bacterium]